MYENYEAILLGIKCTSSKCAIDSLWINGIYSQKNDKIIIPHLKAGKHHVNLKVKAISTRTNLDTTFSFQHTINVLPRPK